MQLTPLFLSPLSTSSYRLGVKHDLHVSMNILKEPWAGTTEALKLDKCLKDTSKSFTLPKEENLVFFSLIFFLFWCIWTIIKNYFTFLLCTHFMRNKSSKFWKSTTIFWVLLLIIKKWNSRFHPYFHQNHYNMLFYFPVLLEWLNHSTGLTGFFIHYL